MKDPEQSNVASSVVDAFNNASDACNRGRNTHEKYASIYSYKKTMNAEGIETVETERDLSLAK